MKKLIATRSHVFTDIGVEDINPGDVCRLSCLEEGNEYILIAVPQCEGYRCSKCAVEQNLGVMLCCTGCSRRGFYFRQIDNLLEEL